MARMSVIYWVKRTYFRALVLLGRALSIPDSPICRVYNQLFRKLLEYYRYT